MAAEEGPVVRVDRGDGNLINMKSGEAKKFVAANPAAKIIGRRPAHDDSVPTPQENAATKRDHEDAAGDFGGMTLAELRTYAEDNGIDLGDAIRKADVLAAVQAAATSEEAATG